MESAGLSLHARSTVPTGTVDTHFHLFGPASEYPYAAHRTYTPPDARLGDYVALARDLGIARAVLVQPSVYGTDNTRLLDGLKAAPIPMRGIVAVGPTVTDDTLVRMHGAGVRGVRINLVFDAQAAVQTALRLGPRLRDLGWHIQFLVDVSTWDDMAETLDKLPVPFVFDHLGHVNTDAGLSSKGFRRMLGYLRDGRAWVKASGCYRMAQHGAIPPYDEVRPFFDAVVEANIDRVLWATDWPHSAIRTAMPEDADLVDMVVRWMGTDQNIQRRIFVENPERLYGFAASAQK